MGCCCSSVLLGVVFEWEVTAGGVGRERKQCCYGKEDFKPQQSSIEAAWSGNSHASFLLALPAPPWALLRQRMHQSFLTDAKHEEQQGSKWDFYIHNKEVYCRRPGAAPVLPLAGPGRRREECLSWSTVAISPLPAQESTLFIPGMWPPREVKSHAVLSTALKKWPKTVSFCVCFLTMCRHCWHSGQLLSERWRPYSCLRHAPQFIHCIPTALANKSEWALYHRPLLGKFFFLCIHLTHRKFSVMQPRASSSPWFCPSQTQLIALMLCNFPSLRHSQLLPTYNS